MARTLDVSWEGFSGGEDSVTAARDPLSIPNGYAERVENLIPAAGRLEPRKGFRWLGETDDLWWLGEYQRPSNGITVMVDNGDLKIRGTFGESTILSGWLSSPCTISQVRIGKYLLLVTSVAGKSVVLQPEGNGLKVFSAYLSGETPITGLEQRVKIPGSGEYAYDGKDLVTPEGIGFSGSPTNGTWVSAEPDNSLPFDVSGPRVVTSSWVRIEAGSGQFDMTTGMPSAQLESGEEAGSRILGSHLRVWGATGREKGFKGRILVKIGDAEIPDGATHLRVYMTEAAPVSGTDDASAVTIAKGLVLRWVGDIPTTMLLGPFEWEVPGNDGMLAASTSLVWNTDRDPMPEGSDALFAGGRLWICGGPKDPNPGRAYFSAIADGATEQLSRLLSFRYDTDMVDTSTDESEPMVGMGLSQGNLILFNSRSVWSLRGASPDYEPLCIDATKGAVGAITQVGQRIFYISQDGPAAVSGSVVDLLTNFKSSYVWPGIYGFSQFFRARGRLHGIWFKGHWVVSDGQHTACLSTADGAMRTWRMTSNISIPLVCSCSPEKGRVVVGGGNSGLFSMFDDMSIMDGTGLPEGGTPFTARLTTNATYVPKGTVSGEAYAIRTDTWWEDKSQLKIHLLGDFGRVADLYQHDDSLEPGVASGYTQAQRGTVTQVVRQGALSHWFKVMLEKNVWAKFLVGGVRLEMIPRRYDTEGISISDPGRSEPILDGDFVTWDPGETVR